MSRRRRKESLIHRAWDWKRTRYIPGYSERAFADEWEKACQPDNSGYGTLQNMLLDRRDGMFSQRIIAWITAREAMIVATIIQWLGTNCGFCWLCNTLKKAGYEVRKIREEEFTDWAAVKLEFSPEKAAILLRFKKTMQMEEIIRMPAEVGQSTGEFRRNFKYLCDVGLCERLDRGKEKYASLTRAGVEMLQFSMFGGLGEDGKGNSILKIRSRMPLEWLENTKLPFDFEEPAAAAPKPENKVSREERIRAIKDAQLERINSRKFGELASA